MNDTVPERRGWWGFLFSDSGPLMRPVSMATFLFNAFISGENLFAWKLTNLIIHLLNGAAVFCLSAHLFSYDRKSISARAWWLAAILAGIWLLHPLHVSTVLYTVQRMTQLSAFFVFTGLLSYIVGRKHQLQGRSGHVLIGLCFLLFLPLAVLSKENGALLPVFVLIVEVLLFRFKGDRTTRRYLLTYLLIFLILPVITGLYYFALHMDFSINYEGRAFTLQERVLTEFRVIWLYIFQLIIPIQRTMGFFHDDFVLSHGWLEPATTLTSLFGIATLLVVAWGIRRHMPLVALGIVIFFAGHSLESTVLPLELVYEHRNYLPSYGVFLAIVSALGFSRIRRTMKRALTIISVVLLTALTFFRSQTWASETSLYNFVYGTHPQSPRVTAIIAEQLTRQERYDDALRILAPVTGSGPSFQRLYIKCRRDKALEPIDVDRAIDSLVSPINDQSLTGILEVARLGLEKGCDIPTDRYSRLLNKAEQLDTPNSKDKQKIALYKAQYQWELGQKEKAIATLERAYSFKQDSPIPLFLATEWLIEMGDLSRANNYFTKAKVIAAGSRFSYGKFISEIGKKLNAEAN